MLRHGLRCRRSAAFLGAGLVAGAVLTGCGAPQTPTAPAAATGPAETFAAATGSAAPTAGSDLAAGLLPAEAFGAGATVTRLPLDLLSNDGHGWLDEETVTPPECRTALDQLTSQFSGVKAAAGQVARADGVRTFEVLAVPNASVNAVEQFKAVVGACGSASFSENHGEENHGDAKLSIDALKGLPDGMAGVSVTFSGTYPDGSWSATTVAGVAQDGDRVLALAQMSHDGTVLDPAAFAGLLQQAYEVQADALD
jgi:hypothetical protein